MSALEQRVQTDLLALAADDITLRSLDGERREALACWATKTAICARSADAGPNLVAGEHGQALARGEMPPVQVIARQSTVDFGLRLHASQDWLVDYPTAAVGEVAELVGRSYKSVVAVGRLLLCVCYWPDPVWRVLVSCRSHVALWPAGIWLTYPYATDRHGVAPTRDTEVIDMVVGTRMVHPDQQRKYTRVSAHKI